MERKIVDLHMHIVPGIDDGSRSIDESIEMLQLAEKQGVTDVFCTSHNGYSQEDGKHYLAKLQSLTEAVNNAGVKIRLHRGCEMLCAGEYVDDMVYGLNIGAFSTLGDTNYVLTELYSDSMPSEAVLVVKTLIEHGYKPIIAHMERNCNLTPIMVGLLIQCGALIQVNAFSFNCEPNDKIRTRAQALLKNKQIHFIGSDAHRIDHRPPDISSGVQYVLSNADSAYAEKILAGGFMELDTN